MMNNLDENELQEKFWSKVVQTNYCWLWNGRMNRSGYGLIDINSTTYYVHRFSAMIHGWSIPEGKEIDHICRTRNCINPGHFRFLTHRENMAMIYMGDLGEYNYSNTIHDQYKKLSNNDKLIMTLAESMGNFEGLISIKKMLEINRFYYSKLIVDPSDVCDKIQYNSEEIIIQPYKRKYFWLINFWINKFNSSLSELEISLTKPFSDDLNKYYKNWEAGRLQPDFL